MSNQDYPGLELEENPKFHRTEWVVQRVGWAAIAAFLLAGVIGLLGPGPLSDREATTSDGTLRVEYCRFDRHHRNAELAVHVKPEAMREDKLRLWLTRHYLTRVEIRTITPEPIKQEATGDRVVYEFPGGNLSGPLVVRFGIEPDGFGEVKARVGIEGGGEVEFRQFIYP